MSEPTLVKTRTVEEGIVVDTDGKILHNALQQDDPVIVQTYSDGTTHLLSSRSGKLIVAPFNPDNIERLRCPHCGGELGGQP